MKTMVCSLAASLATAFAASSDIVIDGRFGDWRGAPIAFVDPVDAPDNGVDLGAVRVISDDRFVHLLIDFGAFVNVQRLPGTAYILLDSDGNAATGRRSFGFDGVDLAIALTGADDAPPQRPQMGVRVLTAPLARHEDNPDTPNPSPYDIGFTFGPTYASDRFEFRIERGTSTPGATDILTGEKFRSKLVFTGLRDRIIDETDVFVHALRPIRTSPPTPDAAIPDKPAKAIRVVSWNVLHSGIFKRERPFSAVLGALDPDIILFQELTDQYNASQLTVWLNTFLQQPDGGRWTVHWGTGGGPLRSAVASRFPVSAVESMRLLEYPDWPEHHLRIAACRVQIDSKAVLVVSSHLRCCGGIGTPEDATRIRESHLINDAIQQVLARQEFDAVLIGGDLNLVGSRHPLDILEHAIDIDRTDLRQAACLQLDGLSNATWADPNQPFAPGRLDYLLYSDSTLGLVQSFTFDTDDVAPTALEPATASDSATASDHLPLVADLRWLLDASPSHR